MKSFTGAIKAPRQNLKGGYISWVNQQTISCSSFYMSMALRKSSRQVQPSAPPCANGSMPR